MTTAHTAAPTIDADDEQARTVAELLLGYADDTDRAAVSQTTLADASDLDRRTLRRVLDRLTAAGWIDLTADATPNTPAVYDVSMARAAGLMARRPTQDAPAAKGPRALTAEDAHDPVGRVHTGERYYIDPAHLDPGENVRKDLRVDDAFLDTISALGVLKDIDVYPTLTGLIVLDGHRRLNAALEAGLESVPVRVVDVDGPEQRIATQLVENDAHAHTTVLERAAAVQQLVLLGVPTAAIRDHGVAADEIAAARKVAADTTGLVADLSETTPDLDLVTLGKIAALADDEAGADYLERATEEIKRDPARVDHVVAHYQREARTEAARRAATEEQTSHGVTVVEMSSTWAAGSHTKGLSDLSATAGGAPLDPDEHAATCPYHAVYLRNDGLYQDNEDRFVPVPVCTEWVEAGHFNRYARNTSGATSGPQEAEVTAERQAVRRRNKAWDTANEVRRTWIRDTLLAHPTAPANAQAAYELRILRAAQNGPSTVAVAKGYERIGFPADDVVPRTKAPRALLAHALACAEGVIEHDVWRGGWAGLSDDVIRFHLQTLVEWGYVPSDAENDLITPEKETD